VALVEDLTFPYGIVTDEAFVYFTIYDEVEGALWRVPKKGGEAVAIASGLDSPSQLVLVGDSLYVTESGGDRVVRVARTGGDVITIANGQDGPADIAFDGTDLYWANYLGNQIVRSDLSGAASVLDTTSDPFRIAVGGGRVYYTALGSDVRWVSIDGNLSGSIVSPGPRDVAVGRDGRIYWTDGGLWRADADGTSIESFGDFDDGSFFDGMAIDEDYVFVAVAEGDIMRFSLPDQPFAVVATGQAAPTIVAVDRSCVYWTNTGLAAGTGSVMRAPRE
jgi:hypothetical protein